MISRATYRQLLSSSLVLLTSFTYGCKVGYTESITTMLSSPNPPFEASSEDISWIASIGYTATFISLIVTYTLGSKVSRKMFLFCCALTFAVTWLLLLVTSSVLVVIVCFFFYGIASSMLGIIGNLYFGEIASPRNREIMGILYSLMTALGGLFEFSLSTFDNYRLLTVFPLLVSVLTLCSSVFMVESPYYLVSRGSDDQAVRNLCWLNDKTDIDDVATHLDSVRKYVNEQKYRTLGNLKIIFQPDNLKLVLAMIVINLTSIVECSTITSAYGPVLIDRFAAINGTLFVSTFNIVGICGLVFSLFTIKKFPRRELLLYGFLIAGLIQSSCAVCYYFEVRNGYQIDYLAFVVAFLLVLLPLASATSIYAALAVLKAEVFPHKFKEFYSSLLAFTSDWSAFAAVKSYFTMSSSIGIPYSLGVYACFSFVGAAATHWSIRDTQGKTLYQIRSEYASTERCQQ